MSNNCKVCEAPNVIRDLIERLRTAGVSYRDAALAIKATRDYDISHAGIQRHEVSGHFSVDSVLASVMPEVHPEDLSLRTVVTHKMKLYLGAHKDEVPNGPEIRAWLKLAADFAEADKAVAETQAIRAAFARPIIKELLAGETSG